MELSHNLNFQKILLVKRDNFQYTTVDKSDISSKNGSYKIYQSLKYYQKHSKLFNEEFNAKANNILEK